MPDKKLRCAVYTRKSTEDGLDQEFNSLDAQHEACAAYADSQRHEGWVLLPERYDDGGFSGGNMERPGLKRLMADVAAGKVDIILLYKIDRLTRSLADFAKIVEVLDKAGASFASITQSFNTTTSMGRLTLNMLLSFAQFEREVTGERIRDKVAASKRKGIWMGGPIPLGYDVRDRKLVVNETDAELVRHVMRRYLEVDSVRSLIDLLDREGHRTKVQTMKNGPPRGGCKFSRGVLYHLLANPIYRGKMRHKDEVHEGEHQAIVSQELWDQVQGKLALKASGTTRRLTAANPSVLAGLVFDGEGRPMTSTHTKRHGRRYRYYGTRPDFVIRTRPWRVSAYDLESLVCSRLAEFLTDHDALLGDFQPNSAFANESLLKQAKHIANLLRQPDSASKLRPMLALIERIDLFDGGLSINLPRAKLADSLGVPEGEHADQLIRLDCAAVRIRKGKQVRLVLPGAAPAPVREPDPKLLALLSEAMATKAFLLERPGCSIRAMASDQQRCRTRFTRLLHISCLAPDIVTAIVRGQQPTSLTAEALQNAVIPLAWSEQRAALGFA